MEALSKREVDLILKRLEEIAQDLEQELSHKSFYSVIILGEKLENTKKEPFSIDQILRLALLAQKMVAIKEELFSDPFRSSSLNKVLQFIASDADYLARMYGVARPGLGKLRNALHSQLRSYFKQQTGKDYQEYRASKQKREREMITAFWKDSLSKALSGFKQNGDLEYLDRVIACLPAWANRQHERWSKQGWREPSAKEVMEILNEYLKVIDESMAKVCQIASSALEQAPVVDRSQVTKEIEQKNAKRVKELREKISAIEIPKEAIKEEKAKLRKQKEGLNKELKELLLAQEKEIKSRVNKVTTYRQKLGTLEKAAKAYGEKITGKVAKEVLEVVTRMVLGYSLEREGDEEWLEAKKEAASFFRKFLKDRTEGKL